MGSLTLRADLAVPVVGDVAAHEAATSTAGRRARWAGRIAAVLVVASEFKLRTRDAGAALAAEVDTQVLVELAAYTAVGSALLLHRAAGALQVRAGAVHAGATTLPPGSPVQALRLVAVLAMVTAFWSPTTIAPVRALQLVVIVELAAEAAMCCRSSPCAAGELLRGFRSVLLVAVAVAAVLTGALPRFGYFTDAATEPRFRLLAMHPIATGILLSVVAVLVLRPALEAIVRRGLRAAGSARTTGSLAAGALCLLGAVATRERAVVISLLVALLVIARLITDVRQRQLLVTSGLALLGVGVLAVAGPVEEYLRRGQSDEQLATLSGRLDLFRVAGRLFVEEPVIGHGYLSGRSVFLPHLDWAGESHNVVVEILVSTGLVGLVVFGFLAVRAWLALRRGLRGTDPARRSTAVDAASLLVLVALLGATTDGVAGPPRLQVIALGIAVAVLEPLGRRPRRTSGDRSADRDQ